MSLISEKSQYDAIVRNFKQSLSAMKEFHNDWREFDEFYLAKQWNKQRASWRSDPVVNYVSYVVDQKKPQLTNNRPTGLITPTAPGDEEAADTFTKVTDVISDRVDLDSRIDEVVHSGLLLDIGWFYVYWDNELKGGSLERRTYWVGDVCVEAPDPSNVFVDPEATRVEDCRYIIYAVPKSIEWIQKYAEALGKKISIEPERTFETEIYNRPGLGPGQAQDSNRALFYAYWWKDAEGIHVKYAVGGYILKEIKNVYKHGRYPFIPFVAKKRRKSIIGIGEPRNIMSNQKLLNKLMEMPTTSALLTANPIALIDAKSGIDPAKWTSKPGVVWKVADVDKAVKWLEPPRFQSDVFKLTDLLTGYIEKIAGIYDATTGETPGAVTAAAAIQMLQEQGSIPIKGIARNLYASIKEVYEQMIELVKEFYTEERYIRIEGENGGYEFMSFNASKYAEVDFDIKISAGASTPTSKAYVAQLSADLFAQGILLPSEYVELQENLPNKDRIVKRLREQEQMPQQQPDVSQGMTPQTPQAAQQAPVMPSLDDMMAQFPPQLQQEVMLMREQGMPDDQIINAILSLGQQAV